jgi:hypothetical protein
MISDSKETDLINRYQQLREKGQYLNSDIINTLSKSAMIASGKKLGVIKGKTFQLGSEEELGVVFDYCLYSHRQGGQNAIERYLKNSPPPEDSDEMLLLTAMTQSFYSVFSVEEVHEGQGVTVRDILTDNSFFLMDIGLGNQAMPRLLLASRILQLRDFYMSTGAMLPLFNKGLIEEIFGIIEKFIEHKKNQTGKAFFSPTHEAAFSAQVIRAALRDGVLNYTRTRPREDE